MIVHGAFDSASLSEVVCGKFDKLKDLLRNAGSVAIAFSGGVDSSFLYKTAVDVLHDNILAFFVKSPLLPPGEFETAREVSALIGGRLVIEDVDPLVWPEFVVNPENRCYLCKKKIFSRLFVVARKNGFECFSDGTNIDDLDDFRPGQKAAEELGVRSFLVEAGLNKNEIRLLSRHLGLPTWNKPSSSCLATRIPAGSNITAEKIDLIAKSETVLNKAGFPGCRVRLRRGVHEAVIELPDDSIERFIQGKGWKQIKKTLFSLGFKKVFLDLSGRPCILNFDM